MTKSNRGIFSNERDVTLRLMIQSGQFSNSYEISSTSTLSASLRKIRSKLKKSYADDKHFPIVNLWDLVITITTKVFIMFPCKAYINDAPLETCYR